MLRCLFHVHTRHSFDSLLTPARVLSRARELRVDVLIVTDHNTLRGAREIKELANGNPRFAVAAAEYRTEKGDIIGLLLSDEVRSRVSGEVIGEIHAQGGITVLPHPSKAHHLDSDLLRGIDLVETYNSRCTKDENAAARDLASRLGRPALGGADAHCEGELGAALTKFDAPVPFDEDGLREILLHSPRTIETRPVSGVYRPASQIIKAVRTRNPLLFLSQARRLATTVVREWWGSHSGAQVDQP